MRLAWAIVGGLLLGGALWWFNREPPRRPPAASPAHRQAQADQPGGLYRWRDDAGRLQVTDTPPKGRSYERIPRDGGRGIEVHGGQ